MEKRSFRKVGEPKREPSAPGERPVEKKGYRHIGEPKKEPYDKQWSAFGWHAVTEAIKAGKVIERLYVAEGSPELQTLKPLLREHHIVPQVVPVQKLNSLVKGTHQGVVALISPIVFQSLENIIPACFEKGKDPFILILDRITDVRNFGALARTAESAGVDAILIPSKGSALIGPDALKTSSGALSHIPVCKSDNLKYSIDFLKNSGLTIVSCTEKSNKEVFYAPLQGPIAVIMGSEEEGISSEYISRSDILVKIPMFGQIASLNVSVAAGVVMYEVVRQRMIHA